jgi:hypothetical protein
MRTVSALLVVLSSTVVTAGSATAGVSLGASCVDGIVTCGVHIQSDSYNWPWVVIQWRYGNSCDSLPTPVPMEPLPVPDMPGWADYTVSFPAPDLDEWIEYSAYWLGDDGSLQPAGGMGAPTSYDLETCANEPPVLTRGYLYRTLSPNIISIEVCPGTCWFFVYELMVDSIDPYEDFLDSGIAVDVWGIPHLDGTPGGTTVFVTAIAPVPPGEPECGPAVATSPVSWSTLKSLYRE